MILAPTLLLNAGSGAAIARPTFSRDFAGEKTLNNGTGPAITFTRASDATFFDASGVLQTATTDAPRFTHDPTNSNVSRGLLLEEARTNSIRNAQAGGAVVGVPGTAPSNWFFPTTQSGITREVAATGTENGMSYIDVRFVGTASANAIIFNAFVLNTQIVATNGQTWTASAYFKLQTGSTSNISNLTIYCDELDVSENFLARSTTNLSPTSSSLSAQRSIVTRTFNNASTAYARAGFRFEVSSGLAIDITFRIAAPQLEQGAFATSYIATTNAAATRAADSAIVTPVSSFYNAAEGTLYAAFRPRTVTGTRTLVAFDNDTEDEQVRLRNVDTDPRLTVNDGGVEQANIDAGTVAAETGYALAGAFKLDDFAASINGAAAVTDTTGTMPTITHLRIGNSKAGNIYNGAIARIAYWPKRLSNALLEQIAI
jgi:hypothetical protein